MKANAAAPAPSPAMQATLDADDALFFLSRTGFSPAPAEVARIVGMTRATRKKQKRKKKGKQTRRTES